MQRRSLVGVVVDWIVGEHCQLNTVNPNIHGKAKMMSSSIPATTVCPVFRLDVGKDDQCVCSFCFVFCLFVFLSQIFVCPCAKNRFGKFFHYFYKNVFN